MQPRSKRHKARQKFDEPFPLPKGKPLVTLRNAAFYITKLPKAECDAPEWQAAPEALLLSRHATDQRCLLEYA
jgi:hypothetical protein